MSNHTTPSSSAEKVSKTFYYLEQTTIFLAHIFLLLWILYILHEGGKIDVTYMFMHFAGMAVYGAILIRGTAFLSQRRHNKSLK